jgi:hypothetical protein
MTPSEPNPQRVNQWWIHNEEYQYILSQVLIITQVGNILNKFLIYFSKLKIDIKGYIEWHLLVQSKENCLLTVCRKQTGNQAVDTPLPSWGKDHSTPVVRPKPKKGDA